MATLESNEKLFNEKDPWFNHKNKTGKTGLIFMIAICLIIQVRTIHPG